MRKFLIVFLALTFVCSGFALAAQIDEGSFINQKEESGGSASDAVRVYTLVRNPVTGVDALGISEGDVLLWDCNSDDAVTINIISEAGQSNDAVAGVAVGAIQTADAARTAETAVGHREWGYIQIYGPNDAVAFDVGAGALSIGQTVVASDTVPGKAEACLPTATTAGRTIMGFAFDAEASTDAIELFIRLR